MRLVRYPSISKIIFPKAIKSFPAQAGKLFITFDDGPNPRTTPLLLELLKKYNCKATFFCLGENASKYPHLLQLIKNDGHLLGNHGFSHLNGFKISTTSFVENIKKADAILTSNLFRPPYGKMTISQYRESSKKFKIILWNVMSYDFDPQISIQKCVKTVTKYARKGSVIVFHDSEKALSKTEKVLPIVIEHFLNKGYSFATLPF